MISDHQVQDFCQEVVEKFYPRKIILYGSYAYNEPKLDSDIDLPIILSFEGIPVKKIVQILLAIDNHFLLNLLVRAPKEIRKRLEMGDFFI